MTLFLAKRASIPPSPPISIPGRKGSPGDSGIDTPEGTPPDIIQAPGRRVLLPDVRPFDKSQSFTPLEGGLLDRMRTELSVIFHYGSAGTDTGWT